MELTDNKSAGILENHMQYFSLYLVAKMPNIMEHLKNFSSKDQYPSASKQMGLIF